jgi:hypothetical protein
MPILSFGGIYEGIYSVSNLGRVRREVAGRSGSSWPGRILKLSIGKTSGSYLHVQLCRDGRARTIRVHILVMRSFVGPPPAGQEVNHKDANKRNPRFSNLEYTTKEGNRQHAKEHGLYRAGDDHPSRLHPERCARGERHGSHTHPERTARGERSGRALHPENYATGERHGMARLTRADVVVIKERLFRRDKQTVIASDFEVAPCTITDIKKERHWRDVPWPAEHYTNA